MRFGQGTLLTLACGLLVLPSAQAQDPQLPAISQALDPPAHIAFVDGTATLDRENESEPASSGMPLVPGDRVRTARGRAEILFPDGTALDLDEFTTIELRSPTLLNAAEGRLQLIVTGAANPQDAATFHIDTPVAGIDTYGPGEYRVSVLAGRTGLETELAVVRGAGALTGDRGFMPLRAGERSATVAGGMPSDPAYFNAARLDAFDRWVEARRDDRRGTRSAQYLPPALRTYGGAFDRDGSWAYESQYGYVWYPTVAAGWRPYYDGYWASVPAYGWTWVGGARWHWPTHHYGRWGVNGHRWYWIPDRHWATAWVSWGAAPGYVTWCPLGFNNRPVFSLNVSIGNPWNGWVVVPRNYFGVHKPVPNWAVGPGAFSHRTPFVAQAVAPVTTRTASRRAGGTIIDNNGVGAANEGRRPARESAGRRSAIDSRQFAANGVAIPRSPSASRQASVPAGADRNGPPAAQRFSTRAPSGSGVAIPRSPQTRGIPVAPGYSRRAGRASGAPNAPTSPVYAPLSSVPPGSTLPRYSTPQTAPFGSPAPASRGRRVAPQYSSPSGAGSARPESSGAAVGRAVHRGQPRENAQPQGSGQGDGQSQTAQPRGARRAR